MQVIVDGKVVDQFESKDALNRQATKVTLTRGLHSVLIRSALGAFNVAGVTIQSGAAAPR